MFRNYQGAFARFAMSISRPPSGTESITRSLRSRVADWSVARSGVTRRRLCSPASSYNPRMSPACERGWRSLRAVPARGAGAPAPWGRHHGGVAACHQRVATGASIVATSGTSDENTSCCSHLHLPRQHTHAQLPCRLPRFRRLLIHPHERVPGMRPSQHAHGHDIVFRTLSEGILAKLADVFVMMTMRVWALSGQSGHSQRAVPTHQAGERHSSDQASCTSTGNASTSESSPAAKPIARRTQDLLF